MSNFDSYRESAHESFKPLPPEVIVARARAATRRRVVVVAAAAAVVIAVAGVGVGLRLRSDGLGPAPNPPVMPSPSVTLAPVTPSPSASPNPGSPSATGTPSGSSSGSGQPGGSGPPDVPRSSSTSPAPAPLSMRKVDVENTTIRFPARHDDDDCPSGELEVVDGAAGSDTFVHPSYGGGSPAYGDVDGDGRVEAVVWGSCTSGPGDDASGQLLVLNGRTGKVAGMGWVGPVGQVINDVTISGGRVVVTVTQKYYDVKQERTYRWNGSRFVQSAGPTAFPSPS
ncbi:hypothetical protein [Winogradskya humida]|uniref:VCBS repeat protein n=1 Tax=Winogradskya humida TaxID=113566 RepID=A0ABQ3ZK70_9ACTN|nr:hypothetical protein [Actinoplanes humidus]GIE18899.1 hypothetical protein Ahu01nite_020010 [Actinoplanes humidus]